jgi:hypothetical protein
MKIHAVEAELFHEDRDRQTDMTNLIVAFSNFANALKKSNVISPIVSKS